jgi:hypothetical protein
VLNVVNERFLKDMYTRVVDLLYYLVLCHTLRIRVVGDYRRVGSMTVESVEVRNEASLWGCRIVTDISLFLVGPHSVAFFCKPDRGVV